MMIWIFFFNDTATTEIYTLSLHDALPISPRCLPHDPRGPEAHDRPEVGPDRQPVQHLGAGQPRAGQLLDGQGGSAGLHQEDRKSTRLNSSHANISYAVFCLKKKKQHN